MANLHNIGHEKKPDTLFWEENAPSTQICTDLGKLSIFKNYLRKHLNRPKIDSLRIRIPYRKVLFINPELGATQVRVNYDTWEIFQKEDPTTGKLVDDTSVVYSKYVEQNGVKARYGVRSVFEGAHVGNQEYVIIGINAKMLKQHYFRGISSDTIRLIWKYIIDQKIIYTDFDTFMSAKVSDVDICIDKYTLDILGKNEFTRNMTCKRIIEMCRTAAKNKDNTSGWTQEKNTGIEFGDRQKVGRRYRTKQYLKFYAKLVELEYNPRSKEFKEAYLDTINLEAYDYPYFLRVETTIKNAAHFQVYDLEVRTLKDLLKVSASAMRGCIQGGINMHLNALKHQVDPGEGFTPMEKMCILFLKPYLLQEVERRREVFAHEASTKEDIDIEGVIDVVTRDLVVSGLGTAKSQAQRNARYRMRKYLTRLAKGISMQYLAYYKNSEIALLEKLQLTPHVLVNDDQHMVIRCDYKTTK